MKNRNFSEISKLETTTETLTARAGLVFFSQFLTHSKILSCILNILPWVKSNKKGFKQSDFIKQMLCFFMDGSSRALSYFDELKQDEGYAASIETPQSRMLSSHAVKRFCHVFALLGEGLFRRILRELFIWRLKIEQPEIIEMTVDTMGMDNDEALKREGCTPTYKKYKGFQPLQLIYCGMIIDAIFRPGHHHSNHSNHAQRMIKDMVNLIRKHYRADIDIVLRLDSGFFDIENLKYYDETLKIGFIVSGKLYAKVKELALKSEQWYDYSNDNQIWDWTEFDYGCDSWKGYTYRTIYTVPRCEEEHEQVLLSFERPENVILTNLQESSSVLSSFSAQNQEHYKEAESIIESHHGRGRDELPHRGLKDFGFQELPFKSFGANRVIYYLMLISFNIFEMSKQEVFGEIKSLNASCYARTLRGKVIDIAGKIIKEGSQWILKVPESLSKRLELDKLWHLTRSCTPIVPVTT